MIKLGVLNCPKCGKEYNSEEYEKLDKAETQTYSEPIISVRQFVNDGICPSCHDMHYDGGNCHCDNDE